MNREITSETLIIMGIDPGLGTTGYGIIEGRGSSLRALTWGGISSRKDDTLASRLKMLYNRLQALMFEYHPQHVAVEEVFVAHNVSSAMKLGQARGVALMTAYSCGAEIGEYSALVVKKAVVGVGSASKEQVQVMVRHLLALPTTPTPADAADALAIAICHYHTLRSRLPLDYGARRSRR